MPAMRAEFERDIIPGRTATAMQHKRSLGEYSGRLVPYGWRLSSDVVQLVAHPAEQRIIRDSE